MSFVRSTTLDSWTDDQLQIMSVGGNQRARTFFKQHGWDDIGSDKIEAKYSSRAAQLYKKQLEKDAANGAKAGLTTPASPTFDEAEKASKSVAAVTKSKATAAATARPRAPRRTGKGGLVVKKMSQKVDDSLFDQAPIEEEPEDIATEPTVESLSEHGSTGKLSRFTMDALEEKQTSVQRGKDGHVVLDMNDDFFSNPIGTSTSMKDAEPMSPTGTSSVPRKSSFGRHQTRSDQKAKESQAGNDAQQRFGNAKSISSASYFNESGRDNDYERQSKLAQFQGSSAISSDAYFGRQSSQGGDINGDLVSKISLTARQDMEQLKTLARETKSQLSRFAQNFMRDLQGM